MQACFRFPKSRRTDSMTRSRKPQTILTHAGRHPYENHGIVNPPVYHASTILHRTLDGFEESAKQPFDTYRYGRIGTPTTLAFEEAVAAVEGGHRAVSTGSGLSAIVVAMTVVSDRVEGMRAGVAVRSVLGEVRIAGLVERNVLGVETITVVVAMTVLLNGLVEVMTAGARGQRHPHNVGTTGAQEGYVWFVRNVGRAALAFALHNNSVDLWIAKRVFLVCNKSHEEYFHDARVA